MKTVLVFAGTTEGRELVETFDRSNIKCHVCVATEYGSQVLKTSDNITVHTGRLDEAEMKQLIEKINCDIVVDATHPYATKVTSQIKSLTDNTAITYIRLLRENDAQIEDGNAFFHESVEQCAKELSKVDGRILLTTGSKQLAEFTAVSGLKERIIARVIPGVESIKLCCDAGLDGNQIVAMQGPFSQEMNEAIISEYGIEHLVTKESGVVGGVDSKYAAARKLGIKVHVIKRPAEGVGASVADGLSIKDTIQQLEELMNITFDKGQLSIVLAGIGPGSQNMMTKEVESAIAEADVIFGAKRMMDSVQCRAQKYPFYLKEDILPVLDKLYQERYSDMKVVILFSGDTGFYSGSKKMYEALTERREWQVKVMPGISSISALCARFGMDWQDSKIISLHGISKEVWSAKILDSTSHNRQTFFITSGVDDIRLLGKLLEDKQDSVVIYLGYQLSYPEEQLYSLSPNECMQLEAEGLYAGVIVAKDAENRFIVPVLDDDYFIRDKVPMTKEEIRKLSICQMKLKENDIVYDIGSGSGSIAVQVGMMSPSLNVFALECNPDAVELIKKNRCKAGLHNINVIEAMAPDGLGELPAADVAFVGGSKGNLEEILIKLYEINPGMRVVMNAVSLETICEMNRILNAMNIENVSITQVSVSKAKKLGDYHMLSASNPVFIFAFDFARKG